MRTETFIFDGKRGIVCRRSPRRPHPLPDAPDKLGRVVGRYQTLDGETVTLISWTHRKKPVPYHGIGSINRIELGAPVRCTPGGVILRDVNG